MSYIFLIILALLTFSFSINAQAQLNAKSETTMTTTANPEMVAVKKASESFMVAFNNLEWEAFRNSFADDATVFFPFWQVARLANGRTEVEATFKSFFDAQKKRKPNPPYQNLVPKDEHIQILGDTAIVTFHLGTELPTGRRTMVYRKQNGKWLIAHMHASNLAKPEEPKKETSAVPQAVAKELVGTYKSPVELKEADAGYKTPIEIKETDGKVFLVVSGQGTLELRQREKDVYSVIQLPDSNFIKVKRDATGKLESIIMVRPQGDLQFNPVS